MGRQVSGVQRWRLPPGQTFRKLSTEMGGPCPRRHHLRLWGQALTGGHTPRCSPNLGFTPARCCWVVSTNGDMLRH